MSETYFIKDEEGVGLTIEPRDESPDTEVFIHVDSKEGAYAPGAEVRDHLLKLFPLDDQKSAGPEPEDHPHDDGFKQRVDRAVEAAAKAAGRAYLEAYGEAFRTALVEDEDRPLQVGDRVELIEDYGHRKAGTAGVVTHIVPTRGDEVGLVRFETGAASVAAYARRLRRVP